MSDEFRHHSLRQEKKMMMNVMKTKQHCHHQQHLL